MSVQEEKEWEQEVEDARRAQIESREAKRVKEEADEPAEPAVDDDELALSEPPRLGHQSCLGVSSIACCHALVRLV